MADQEMSYEELQQRFIQTNSQLEHQVMVNQELQKALGEQAGKAANLQVAVNSLKQYAQSLEAKVSQMEQQEVPKPNRQQRRAQEKAEKKDKPQPADK
jgi:hypothetical protein